MKCFICFSTVNGGSEALAPETVNEYSGFSVMFTTTSELPFKATSITKCFPRSRLVLVIVLKFSVSYNVLFCF